MFEELIEVISKPWLIAIVGFTALPSGRKFMRKVAKGTISTSWHIFDEAKAIKAEVQKEVNDIRSEVRDKRKKKLAHR